MGTTSGGLAATIMVDAARSEGFWLETFGGVVGGFLDAKIADVIDPPTSGRHRCIAHGAVTHTVLVPKL